MGISSNQEAVRLLIKKDRLTEKEADLILSGIDKRLFHEKLISLLKYKHLLTDREISDLFLPPEKAELRLPVSIFAHPELSALEAVCRYLKDDKGMRYSDIAGLLNRDQRTIWATYTNSLKKKAGRLDASGSKHLIPLSVFKDRRLSVLEAIAHHLKENYHLRYSEIAVLINRDERNIWNICSKAEEKLHA